MLDELATGAGRLIRQSLLPPLADGFLYRNPDGALSAGGGEPAPQPWLRQAGALRRADDVTGGGFRLFLTRAEQRTAALQRCAERSGCALFVLSSLQEVHGLMADWLDRRGATAVLVRPDHVIYGSATGADAGMVLARALERDLGASWPGDQAFERGTGMAP
jgi:3-(3-hydroxy-phenyl)propionate hydroxylase